MSNSTAHDALIPMAERYARSQWEASITIPEPPLPWRGTGEIPDLYCYRHPDNTHTVDIKMSTADSQAHLSKTHVADPRFAMGRYRWILAPINLQVCLPERYGHLGLDDQGGITVIEEAVAFPPQQRNLYGELQTIARHAMKQAWSGGSADSQGAKQSGNRVAKRHYPAIAEYVAAHGPCRTLEAARALKQAGSYPAKRAGTLANWIAQDARAGLMQRDGVTYDESTKQLLSTETQ